MGPLVSRLTLLAVWLVLGSVRVGAIGRESEQRTVCNPGQQFYFEPTGSCKNCSDLELMLDNYGKWRNLQLEGEPTDSAAGDTAKHGQGAGSSTFIGKLMGQNGGGSRNNDNSTQRNSGNHMIMNKTMNAGEVSIFKSRPTSASTDSYYDSDVVLSRLISLDDRGGSQEQEGEYSDLESASQPAYLDSSPSSASSSLLSANAGSSSDLIREQTKQVTKFVSQFIRFQPVIGTDLLRVIEECRHNQNASACQMWSNLCVITMYSYSDTPSALKQPDHYHHQRRRLDHEQELLSSAAAAADSSSAPSSTVRRSTILSSSAAPRKELADSHDGWQQCRQFTLTSICNSLRDWHRLERKSTGLGNALQSIYATIDEPFSSPIGATVGALPAPGLVLRPNQQLQLLAYVYSFDGNLIAVEQFGPSEMEKFCLRSHRANSRTRQRPKVPASRVQTGHLGYFRFGNNMKLEACRLTELDAFQLLEEQQLADTLFVDLYVAYQAGGSMLIKPVPILVKNLLYNENLINQKYSKDSSRWRLVHRFFQQALIRTPNLQQSRTDQSGSDRQSRQSSTGSSQTETGNGGEENQNQDQLNLLYAKSVVLDLKFRKLDKGASLSSILLTIDYGIVSRSSGEFASASSLAATAARHNKSTLPLADLLQTELLLEQSLLDMQAYKKDLDLAITILSILSSIWSLIKCYNIQKCCGNVKLDLESLVRFLIIGCDTVGLLLLAVLFIFITYLFVLLKFQHSSVQVLAPNEQLESSLLLNLQLAFCFKFIGLAHKLYVHLNADIFFIDWERPRMLTSSQILNLSYQRQQNQIDQNSAGKHEHPGRPLSPDQQSQQQQVSFWRPYTVINRWFQMQTLRRLNLTVQLISFVLMIQLTRASRFASADLSLNWSADELDHEPVRRLVPCQSVVFRTLIFAYIYLGLAVCQILYKKYFHEPWIRDPVREFVDLCSVANVSLFCWLYPRYGYYIHGRNANGSGDRGIGEMNALLEREERDLCSKRGLAPNSDQQTFILILPKVINDHYRNLLSREATSFASKLSSMAPNQLIGKQMFQGFVGQSMGNADNSSGQPGDNRLLRSALNLSASALSVAGSSPPSAPGAPNAATFSWSRHSRIDRLVAKHKSIQQFLTNFLEHVYKDIDYAIRDGRKFENLLLLDFDLVEENAPIALPGAGARSPTMQSNPAAQSILANQQQAQTQHQQQQQQQQRHQAATFCKDVQNRFTSLLWLGVELDLLLIELLSFLVLDLWLGQPALLYTASLLWFLHQAFKAIYISCSRYNLITKALVDEKFLSNAA